MTNGKRMEFDVTLNQVRSDTHSISWTQPRDAIAFGGECAIVLPADADLVGLRIGARYRVVIEEVDE